IRKIVGDMPILVPGVGAQGGDVEKVITAGKTIDGTVLIVNSSREIIYASSDDDFADAAREVAMALRDEINKYR
ncbi:MAG: orotidine 5'-phosphate decarboxylase, partial [Gammaproteobacteria bacterium]